MTRGPLSPENYSAAEVIADLGLAPIDREGGFFRLVFTSSLTVPGGSRPACSSILMFVTPDGFSALHRLRLGETWCFHAGDALELLLLRPDGRGESQRLGLDRSRGEKLQAHVPADCWQGARLPDRGRWALLSCVVTPAFSWDDFELGERAELVAAYPKFSEAITALTRLVPPAGVR